jgi:ubiquinol-cytochrome c reductase cytochrome c subunit
MPRTMLRMAVATLSAAALTASPAFAGQSATPAGDAAKGRATFERIGCYQCHGDQGQGGREGSRIASPVPLTWPALSRFVRTARRNMPPYTEKVLSNEDLADVYAYLRSIPPAPDFKAIPLLNGMMTVATPQR